MKVKTVVLFIAATAIATFIRSEWPQANPISVNPASLFVFRDYRGLNDVHIGQGDVLEFGSDKINGGSLGTS
jgi:hypothetical protein